MIAHEKGEPGGDIDLGAVVERQARPLRRTTGDYQRTAHCVERDLAKRNHDAKVSECVQFFN